MKDVVIFDTNNIYSYKRLALVKVEKDAHKLIEQGYMLIFSPKKDKIPFFILAHEQSENQGNDRGGAE